MGFGRYRSIAAAAFAVLAAAALVGCGGITAGGNAQRRSGMPTARQSAGIEVQVISPTRGELKRENQFAGQIEASQNVKVYPKTSGTVSAVHFSVGDTVEKGDLLFELDSTDAQKNLRQAQITYQKTIADLNAAESGSSNALTELQYQTSIENASNKLVTMRENLNLATNDDFDMKQFRKVRQTWKDAAKAYKNDPTDENWQAFLKSEDDYYDLLDDYSDYKTQVTNFENAYNDYEEALEKYEIYKNMTSVENASNRALTRSQAELTYANAQQAVANCRIYAPVSGTITARGVDVYGMASAQSSAFTITAEGLPAVAFNLTESGAQALRADDDVAVLYQGKEYAAVVTEISPEADSSGLYAAKAQLTEEIGIGHTGTVVKVRITTAREENALVVPLDLIDYDGNQPYVFVYENGVARRADLTLGITTVDSVSVTDGLSEDSLIITTWNPNLKDGAAVYTADQAPAQAVSAPEAGERPAGMPAGSRPEGMPAGGGDARPLPAQNGEAAPKKEG